jgi:crotonobetainyl-CoA:carnitine CoA-transferase CaiB-like acyl-CoA transferase
VSGPLDGVLVADFTRLLAGPHAAMMLADLGADVVKVEQPGGDDARTWGPPYVADGSSVYFQAANRGKRSIVLDLKSPEGSAAAVALAARAGILLHNFRPGAAEPLGLGHGQVAAANPAIVYCAISGFGPDASDALGNDFLLQAVGGLLSVTGPAGGPGVKVGFPVVDVLTGCYAAIGVLAAWSHRVRTGEGQLVEVDLMSSLLASLANQAGNHLNAGLEPTALGTDHPSIAPYASYATAGGEIAVAVASDRQFAGLAQVIGRPELAGEPRFSGNGDRVAHRDELRDELESALGARPAAEWLPLLRAAGVPAGVAHTVPEAFAFAREVGLSPEVWQTTADGERIGSVAAPFRLAATPVRYHRPPPRVGEHTDEVLHELGLAPPTG